MKNNCSCPIYCLYCGAKLKKDTVGKYCPTKNCQQQFGLTDNEEYKYHKEKND